MTKVRVDATQAHTTESILADALQVIGCEVSKLKASVTGAGQLDPTEARVLGTYVDLILKLSKEQREAKFAQQLESVQMEKLGDLFESDRHPNVEGRRGRVT